MTRLHSYLNFAGNAEEAFDFYRSVFGGEFSSVVRFKDLPIEGVSIPEEDQDKIMHIGLPIGNDDKRRPRVARATAGPGQQRLHLGSPGKQRRGGQDIRRSLRGGRDRDAHRRPGVGRLLRKLQGQVRSHVDGELQPRRRLIDQIMCEPRGPRLVDDRDDRDKWGGSPRDCDRLPTASSSPQRSGFRQWLGEWRSSGLVSTCWREAEGAEWRR